MWSSHNSTSPKKGEVDDRRSWVGVSLQMRLQRLTPPRRANRAPTLPFQGREKQMR